MSRRGLQFIVDANRGHCFRPGHLTDEAREILRRIEAGCLAIVTGGKNLEELVDTKFVRVLKEYRGSGVTVADDKSIEKEEKAVGKLPLTSDDPHVIALARATRGRILYTADADLMSDFTNKKLISRPGGRVFQRLCDHTALLDACKC